MKPKVYLVVTAVIALIIGIIFIAMRNFALGITGAMGAGLIAQILGANFIGFAVLNFFARNLEGEGMRVVLLANFISNVLAFILMVVFGITTGLNTLGWIATLVYLVLTLVFGVYLFGQPRPAMATMPCPEPPC